MAYVRINLIGAENALSFENDLSEEDARKDAVVWCSGAQPVEVDVRGSHYVIPAHAIRSIEIKAEKPKAKAARVW